MPGPLADLQYPAKDSVKSKPRHQPGGHRRWFFTTLGLFTLLGGLLRFNGLGDRDFWFDESCTFVYVHDLFDWPEDSSLLAESTNLPYYVLLRGWVSIFGDSEANYRSMSALVATLTIPLLGFLASRIGGRLLGIVCAALVAFHPLQIHYAHEARAYALWVFHLSVTLFVFYEAARRGSWKWWVAYGVVLLAGLHLHYFTVYWVPATAVAVLIAENRRRCLGQWLTATLAVGLGFLPYFFLAVWPAARAGGSAWIGRHWEPLTAIPRTLWAFMPAGAYPAHLRGLSLASPDTVKSAAIWLIAGNGIARTVPAVLVIAMFLFLARRVWLRQKDGAAGEKNICPHLLFGTLTLLPLILAWLYSVVVRPNYLVGRYDLVAWPACMIWLALAITQFAQATAPHRKHLATAVICLLLIACSLIPIARMASLKPPPTFHNLRAQRLAELAGPTDLVIAFSYDRDYLLYYLHRVGFAGRIVSYPSWLDRQIGWVDTEADLAPDRSELVIQDAFERVALIDLATAQGGRVWLLDDSIEARGGKARTWINARFLTAVATAGYVTRPVDEGLLIGELTPPLPP